MATKLLAQTEEAPPSPPTRRPRADARRNRERLVEIAAADFAAHGTETSLKEIARRAGVGIGTLYRHFPTREHLVEVVYRREVEALCAAADELSAHHAPDVALAEWMQRFVDYIAAKRGMANSLRISVTTNSELFAETSGKVSLALRAWSTLRSPTDRSARMSTCPMSSMPWEESIRPPPRPTGATAPAALYRC